MTKGSVRSNINQRLWGPWLPGQMFPSHESRAFQQRDFLLLTVLCGRGSHPGRTVLLIAGVTVCLGTTPRVALGTVWRHNDFMDHRSLRQ